MTETDKDLTLLAVRHLISVLDAEVVRDLGLDELDPIEHGDIDRLSDNEVEEILSCRAASLKTQLRELQRRLEHPAPAGDQAMVDGAVEAMNQIVDILRLDDPDNQWDAGTIEQVGEVVVEYLRKTSQEE